MICSGVSGPDVGNDICMEIANIFPFIIASAI
jgi:hypothetical protein